MKILLTCSNFNYLSGAPMYVYELSRELKNLGHDVTILSATAGELVTRAEQLGIRVLDFANLDQIRNEKFDIIHSQEPGPTQLALSSFPTTPIVCTIHSEWGYEEPIRDERIKHYICIRPSVEDKLHSMGITNTSVIYNPIDFKRFSPSLIPQGRKVVLFAGTVDGLRKASALDLIRRSQAESFDVMFIGDKFSDYANNLPSNCIYQPAVWNIEDYVGLCTETAGIMLGRTTIEGWACGRPCWIYDVDLDGRIKSVELVQPPPDIEKFNSENVVKQIQNIYNAIL